MGMNSNTPPPGGLGAFGGATGQYEKAELRKLPNTSAGAQDYLANFSHTLSASESRAFSDFSSGKINRADFLKAVR